MVDSSQPHSEAPAASPASSASSSPLNGYEESLKDHIRIQDLVSTPNKYANVGGTKVIPICPCESANCPYPKGERGKQPVATITHYRTWGMDHIIELETGVRIPLSEIK